MLTDPEMARLPKPLHDIVVTDRALAAARRPAVVRIAEIRALKALRADQHRAAHSLYGRAPLRGETGPGRPTAARA